MKLLLLFALVVLTIGFQQTVSQDSDLVVTKFTWARYQQVSRRVHGAAENVLPIGPGNRRSQATSVERQAETASIESNARNAPVKEQPDFYALHLELRNGGSNVIKSFVWEYRPEASRPDYEPRQYLCRVDAKPDETKKFDILTPFAPVKVVTVPEKKANSKDGKVIINQIEYSDRAAWKRKGWEILVPPELTETLSVGKCLAF